MSVLHPLLYDLTEVCLLDDVDGLRLEVLDVVFGGWKIVSNPIGANRSWPSPCPMTASVKRFLDSVDQLFDGFEMDCE